MPGCTRENLKYVPVDTFPTFPPIETHSTPHPNNVPSSQKEAHFDSTTAELIQQLNNCYKLSISGTKSCKKTRVL
eukprot:3989849-Amphidinium_carterae.1